jgi:lipoprotein-releasing system permease protein
VASAVKNEYVMLKIFLWLRYLGKRRVVLLSIAAVALSCALLIVVASLFNGFIDAFEQAAVDAVGDVVLSPPEKFEHYHTLIEELEKLEAVEAATATLSSQGLLHLGAGNVRAAGILGIEVEKRGKVTAFERSLLKGKGKSPRPASEKIEGYIGIGVLAQPDEQTDEYDFDAVRNEIGREVVLTTGSVIGGQDEQTKFRRRIMRLVIADVVFTGIYYLDNSIVRVPIERLQEEVYPELKTPIAEQIEIKLAQGYSEESAMAQIRGVWEKFASEQLGWENFRIQGVRIKTAREMQSRYVAEIRKQMGMLLLIFGVVSFSAVLLVFCIFYMIVEARRRDVAILKSCGVSSMSVAMVFIGFGAVIGVVGALVGMGIGYVVTTNINTIEQWIGTALGLKLWKASVYIFSRIPNEVDWSGTVRILISAVAAAALGALIPAITAARTKPVNILRYE